VTGGAKSRIIFCVVIETIAAPSDPKPSQDQKEQKELTKTKQGFLSS